MSETKTRADLDYALNTVVGYRLKRAYMVMKDDYAADPNLAELTTRQFAVLSLTGGESGISQSDIARKLGIERSGMVKLIDQLNAWDTWNVSPIRKIGGFTDFTLQKLDTTVWRTTTRRLKSRKTAFSRH